MATARGRLVDVDGLGRAAALVACCTLVLTASFVGLVSLVSGQAVGTGERLPGYVLAMAAAFVASILLFETRWHDGQAIIATAGAVALGTFVFVTLGAEGLAHAARNPGRVVASHLLFYFLAAGMIATGLGYWAVNHWQELDVRPRSRSGF